GWRKTALLAVLLLGGIGLQLLSPQVMRGFIDSALAGRPLDVLATYALTYVGISIVAQILSVATTYVGQDVGWSATNRIREDLAWHCLGLDLNFYHKRTPGELIERLDGDITALSNFFSQLVIQVFGSGLLVVGTLVLLFREDW